MNELDAEVDALVYEGLRLIDQLYLTLDDLPVEPGVHVPCALYYISMQHSVGAMLLLKQLAHAPAFALARPIFETYVRATWFLFVAKDDEKVRAERDDFPRLSDLIAILKSSPHASSIVGRYEGIRILHSFTHGGSAQIYGHLDNQTLAPHFLINDQMALVDWAVRTAISSSMLLAIAVKRNDLAHQILEELPDKYKTKRA